jgi:hypothetical protein
MEQIALGQLQLKDTKKNNQRNCSSLFVWHSNLQLADVDNITYTDPSGLFQG